MGRWIAVQSFVILICGVVLLLGGEWLWGSLATAAGLVAVLVWYTKFGSLE